MQAIILAAGMGKRLKQLTNNNTKCMVKVNGTSIISRMLAQLDEFNLSKIVIVTGYKGEKLKEYIKTLNINTNIVYIDNDIYDKTNNIYSLYLAKDYLIEEDTLLLESDLIFEKKVLKNIMSNSWPNLALVSKYERWMDGTVFKIDENNNIKEFIDKNKFKFSEVDEYYKTVNIYKFSKEFSENYYVPFLIAHIRSLGRNEYYEQVLKVISLLGNKEIKVSKLNDELWYEIDDIQDLDIAETIFESSYDKKLEKIQNRYGGYWRYPKLIDFCYLVNPFYPPKKLIDEMKCNFSRLLFDYPSGMDVNSLLAAKYFGVNKEQIVIGNGAAELIKILMENISGKIGVILPTFEEYPNRKKEDIVEYNTKNSDYRYNADDLIQYYNDKKIKALLLINPDNPSGNYIKKEDVIKIAKWANSKEIMFIVDESFIDFVDIEEDKSLIDENILNEYSNLIIIKSISKSFGVPGLRLGILVSNNIDLVRSIKSNTSIWNINSFAEFYMQICEKYKNDYKKAMDKFKYVRKNYIASLSNIENLRVISSQANYIMCELKNGFKARDLTKKLLCEKNIFIKDLSNKKGIEGEYIRIAVKDVNENNKLIEALNELLK